MKNISKKKLIWLIVATIIVIVEIKAFTDSRADKLLEIKTNIVDASGLLDVEKIKLEAGNQNEAGYYVILPDYINGKKASRYFIEEKSIISEDDDSSKYENSTGNNLSEESTDNTSVIGNNQETETVNEMQINETEEKNEDKRWNFKWIYFFTVRDIIS